MKIQASLKLTPYKIDGIHPSLLCQNIATKQIANIAYHPQAVTDWQPVKPEIFINDELYAQTEQIGVTRMFSNDNLIFEYNGAFGVYYPNDSNSVIGFFDTKEEAKQALTDFLQETAFYTVLSIGFVEEAVRNGGVCFLEGKMVEKGILTEEGDFIPENFFKAKLVDKKVILYLS